MVMDFWETAALKWPELMVITLWQVLVDVKSCFVSLKAWGEETEDLLKVIFFICDVSDVCVRARAHVRRTLMHTEARREG